MHMLAIHGLTFPSTWSRPCPPPVGLPGRWARPIEQQQGRIVQIRFLHPCRHCPSILEAIERNAFRLHQFCTGISSASRTARRLSRRAHEHGPLS